MRCKNCTHGNKRGKKVLTETGQANEDDAGVANGAAHGPLQESWKQKQTIRRYIIGTGVCRFKIRHLLLKRKFFKLFIF